MGDLVTRAVSGHATEQMQHHYSTVRMDEMRGGLDRVAVLANLDAFRPGGVLGGVHKEVMGQSA